MNYKKQTIEPDSTAVRVALWRALHTQVDLPPYVLEDDIGLKLVSPESGWQKRPDMDPQSTRLFRASILARARFIEDLVIEQVKSPQLTQYVILGAGLDSFAQRQQQIASRLKIFEVDKSSTQSWKRQRLIDLGFGIPEWLKLVPVNFEAGDSWWDQLIASGFDVQKKSCVASTGVSMYLTQEAIQSMMIQVAKLAAGSTFVMSFLLPLDLMDSQLQIGFQYAQKGAEASGTPFISFFSPKEIKELALKAGFKEAHHISASTLAGRYFQNRTDKLRPLSGEELLVATT